jgi:methionyl aminopeptidase
MKAILRIKTDRIGSPDGQWAHDPSNAGRAGRGFPLKPGLVIAIEPWFMRGTDKLRMDPDCWTLRSADGSRTAHSEHTIAINGPIILTRPRQ